MENELNTIIEEILEGQEWTANVQTAKARDHYLMANIVPIAWVQAMIEIIGYITGIGFLIWLIVALALYAVANHWGNR